MQQIEVDNLKWYVLYTAPRAEKQVENRIRGMGVICWLPLHKSPRAWSDRVKIVEMPLFPSYIFVKSREADLYNLLRIPGVSRIVYYNGKPAVVREKELDTIRAFLEEAANHPLVEGEEAEIVCGVMKHVSGKSAASARSTCCFTWRSWVLMYAYRSRKSIPSIGFCSSGHAVNIV